MLTIISTEFRRASHQPPGQGSLVKQTTTTLKSSKRVVFQRGAAETFLESEGWQMLFGR